MLFLQGEWLKMSEALLSDRDSECMQLLMVWLDNKESESKCRVGPLEELSRSSGAIGSVSSPETSCTVQLFIQFKNLLGNAMQSTLLFSLLHPVSKGKHFPLLFFSPLYKWHQNTCMYVWLLYLSVKCRLTFTVVGGVIFRFSDLRNLSRVGLGWPWEYAFLCLWE